MTKGQVILLNAIYDYFMDWNLHLYASKKAIVSHFEVTGKW